MLYFLSCKTPLRGIYPKRVEGSLLFKRLATHLKPSAALSNRCFQEPKGGGEGKAFLPIFLHGLVCEERGRVSSRQAGEQDGGLTPTSPP